MKNLLNNLCFIIFSALLLGQKPPPSNQFVPPNNTDVNIGPRAGTMDGKNILTLSDKVFNTESDVIDFEKGTFKWKGKTFSIENSRIFKARFERYLNSPIPGRIFEYNEEMEEVLQILALHKLGDRTNSIVDAWEKLSDLAEYEEDENRSLIIANTISDVWRVKKENRNLNFSKEELERLERYQQTVIANRKSNLMKKLERRSKLESSGSRESVGGSGEANKEIIASLKEETNQMSSEGQFRLLDLAKTTSKIAGLETQSITNALQAKLIFQSQILSLFMQRSFKHCLIACNFYRYIFSGSAQKLDKKILKEFFPDSNFVATVNSVEQLSLDALSDIKASMIAIDNAYLSNQKVTALRRLQETFFLGERNSLVKVFDLEKKQQLLQLYREIEATQQLADLKDYDAVELSLGKITSLTSDFPDRSVLAYVNANKRASNIALMSAQQQIINGEGEKGRIYLEDAIRFWPLNPAVDEFTSQMNREVNLTFKATETFDNLLKRKNYREIYDRSMEFGLAFSQDPERAAQLKEISQNLLRIDGLIVQSDEFLAQENSFAAWEFLDQATNIDPDDPLLNRAQSKLAPKVALYVNVIDQAQSAERKGFYPKSLVKYLQAQDQYPASRICRIGIERVSNALLETIAKSSKIENEISEIENKTSFKDL